MSLVLVLACREGKRILVRRLLCGSEKEQRVVVEGEEKRALPEENGGLKTVHLSRRA